VQEKQSRQASFDSFMNKSRSLGQETQLTARMWHRRGWPGFSHNSLG
jgi:hypothetical protein